MRISDFTDGSVPASTDYVGGYTPPGGTSGNNRRWSFANISNAVKTILGLREVLASDRTYFVRTDGNDSNNGLSNTSGGAFLTINHALNVVFGSLDLGGHNVTIQVGAGTYTAAVSQTSAQVGAGTIILLGDTTTPSNVVLSVTSATCITVSGYGTALHVRGFKFVVTTAGNCLVATNGGLLVVDGNVEFGACAASTSQIFTGNKGIISITANYTISGGGGIHWDIAETGQIAASALTITLTGTPAFSVFCRCTKLSYGAVQGNTFSGGATGTRYSVADNSVLRTDGGGANYLPGNAAGSTGTGGQYL